MFAEFFGKETGFCHGRGGSMQIADVKTGTLGANGIVGAALMASRLGRDDVTLCFLGDGANNEGAFHEAMNTSAIWKWPVVLLCETNKYGMSPLIPPEGARGRRWGKPDLSVARPFQIRPQSVPHQGQDQGLDCPRPDCAVSGTADQSCWADRGRGCAGSR
jgi:hypothetical protein